LFQAGGSCGNNEKDQFDTLESPLHLGQFHHTVQKSGQAPFAGELGRSRFNTVRNNPTADYNIPTFYLTSRARTGAEAGEADRLVIGSGFPEWARSGELGMERHMSDGNIYAEVDREYEVDSGFTEESSDLASERKEDSLYTNSSTNSILGFYNQLEPKKSRIVLNPPGVETYRDSQTSQRKTLNPNVFSISKTLQGSKASYYSSRGEERDGRGGAGRRQGGSREDGRMCELHQAQQGHQVHQAHQAHQGHQVHQDHQDHQGHQVHQAHQGHQVHTRDRR
jgi:hypothetical protein